MCLFKGYFYILCSHIDYVITARCAQSDQDLLGIFDEPGILDVTASACLLPSGSQEGKCTPRHAEPEKGVADSNVHEFFVVPPDEIGPTVRGSNIPLDENAKDNPAAISGLCAACTTAVEELISMYQTYPNYGLVEEEMVLDDATVVASDVDGDEQQHQHQHQHHDHDDSNDEQDHDSSPAKDYNEEAEKLFDQRPSYYPQHQISHPLNEALFDDFGFPLATTTASLYDAGSSYSSNNGDDDNQGTAHYLYAAQFDMHTDFCVNRCITPSSSSSSSASSLSSQSSSTAPLANDSNSPPVKKKTKTFVENFDILDDPFAIHGDTVLEVFEKDNTFLNNSMRVLDEEDSVSACASSNSCYYFIEPQSARTSTSSLVIRPKEQHPVAESRKRKRSNVSDVSSLSSSSTATITSAESHRRDNKMKMTGMASEHCRYALRSRPNVSLESGL